MMKKINKGFMPIILSFGIILFVIVSCEAKQSTTSWNEGFNTSWVGTYVSQQDADYIAAFRVGADGTYSFAYGGGVATTYAGKYNKNFNNGTTKSPFRYTITGLRVIGFDEKSMTISVDWKLPNGDNTESFVLYRK
jgi:hypothetical protein